MIVRLIIPEKYAKKKEFNIVNLPINLGIGGAVQTGYKYAYENGYDVAVQVDGDGQHDPEFLNTMADYLIEHQVDMVIGSRFIEKGVSVIDNKKNGNSVLFKINKSVDRKNYRSNIRVKNDRT